MIGQKAVLNDQFSLSSRLTKRYANVYLGLSMLGGGLSLVEAGEATVVPVNKGR